MKKLVLIGLSFTLVFSTMSMSFADAYFSDIGDTPYAYSVRVLSEGGTVSGYKDGTFKPENKITRAEACTIIVKAMNVRKELLIDTAENNFSDVQSGSWVFPYINFAASKNIVHGKQDGSFYPKNNVTYFEMAAMLVNACGIDDNSLVGKWPNNYYNKAVELGIFSDISLQNNGFNGNDFVSRGNAAVMVSAVSERIAYASKRAGYSSLTEQSDPTSKTDKIASTGELLDYDGKAYGIIIDVSEIKNEHGADVQELKFLYNGSIEYAITERKNTFNGIYRSDGTLDCLKMNDGIVAEITSASGSTPNYTEYTVPNGFTPIMAIKDHYITIMQNQSEIGLTIAKDAYIYIETLEGSEISYQPGKISDISKDKQVRLFSVKGSSSPLGPVEIVIVR